MPNASSGRTRGLVPAGSVSLQTSGTAFKIESGTPMMSAPIEPYLKCSDAGLRIGVEVPNRSSLPSPFGHVSASAVTAASAVHAPANAVPISSP